MKKLFVFLTLAVCSLSLAAQEEIFEMEGDGVTPLDSDNRISIGPKVGINYASMNGLGDEYKLDPKGAIGFQGGLAANFHFGRRTSKSDGGTGLWGLQVEALFSQRTIKMEGSDDLKLSCLEVPILAQFYATPSLCIELGPTFSGTLSSSPDQLVSGDMAYKTGDLKAFDVMLTAGVGYKHKSGLTVGGRYNLGMSELAGNFEGKVSTFTVSVGYLFNLIK